MEPLPSRRQVQHATRLRCDRCGLQRSIPSRRFLTADGTVAVTRTPGTRFPAHRLADAANTRRSLLLQAQPVTSGVHAEPTGNGVVLKGAHKAVASVHMHVVVREQDLTTAAREMR